MKAIVNVDKNWGIGCNGQLLIHIPEDMRFFKSNTLNNVVIMGRETFESLPNKAPLSDRINIVLSKNESFNDDRVIICRTIEETLEKVKEYDTNKVFIIGGASIYKQFLPYCDEVIVTKVQKENVADKYFPNLDLEDCWSVEKGEIKEHKGVKFNFNIYKRI